MQEKNNSFFLYVNSFNILTLSFTHGYHQNLFTGSVKHDLCLDTISCCPGSRCRWNIGIKHHGRSCYFVDFTCVGRVVDVVMRLFLVALMFVPDVIRFHHAVTTMNTNTRSQR